MLIIHASSSSKIVSLAEAAMKQNKKVFAIEAPENEHLFRNGISRWIPENKGDPAVKLSGLL